MEKKKILAGGVAAIALVLLLGAGCKQNADDSGNADTSSDAETQENVSSTADASSVPADISEAGKDQTATSTADQKQSAASGLTLTAEAMGNNQVKFTWTTEEKLTDANRFIIVRGVAQNPERTAKSYWLRQYQKNREIMWGNQPAGTFHYRICLTENNQNDACVTYSNDVMVEVK